MNRAACIRRVRFLLLLTLYLSATYAPAQIPRTLSYQGILSDTLGTPKPDGLYAITFRLYDAPSGGTLLWVETQSLQVRRGLFSAVLGSQTPFPSSLAFERQYWLGIQVSPEPELSPRIALSAVGYSLNALRADTARVALNAGIFADSARIAGTVPNNSITAAKIASGQVVKSLNGLRDAITLRAQGGATITSSGDTITINAGSGGGGTGVQSIQNTNNTFDILNPSGPTVTANLKVPLSLSANVSTANSGVITVSNTSSTNSVHGLVGRTSSTSDGAGVYGESFYGAGVSGRSTSLVGVHGEGGTRGGDFTGGSYGVFGFSPTGWGIWGGTSSNTMNSTGVYGVASATSGEVYGVRGVATSSSAGVGVRGEGTQYGVRGIGGVGVLGESTNDYGVRGESMNSIGVSGFGGAYGVFGSSTNGVGVKGVSSNNDGVDGYTFATNGAGVWGTGQGGDGVVGFALTANKTGVYGLNNSGGVGIVGTSSSNDGVQGFSGTANRSGVWGSNDFANGVGVAGSSSSPNGYAGYFQGRVTVTGTLSKGGGSFQIDHPLDPTNKYLYHSFVESPDMMNIYNGNVVLDGNGEAVVTLPAWFEALNKDFRYQLTPIGAPGPNLYVAQKISSNRFKIAGGTPGLEVSWQVTGIRHDPFAEAHRIQVEVDKTPDERGKYLHPKEYGVSESLALDLIRYQREQAQKNLDRANELEAKQREMLERMKTERTEPFNK